MSRERTHYDECWRNHHKCAIRRITELEAALAERTRERDEARMDVLNSPFCEEALWQQRRAEMAEAALAERTKERDDLAHDVERHLNIAVSAEMDRDAAIKRAEAAEAMLAEYRAAVIAARSQRNLDGVGGE